MAFVTKLAGFEYTNHIAPSLTNHGIPLFKGKNIQGNNIIYEFESFIPRNVSDNLPRSQINKKCILLPYVGTLGNIGVHTKKGIFHLGSNVGKIELTCNEFHALLLEEYIVFYLRSSYGFKGLVREKKATAQDSISIQAIRNICIPIPPFAEQKRIVTQIGTLFDCVDELEQSVDSLGTVVSLTKQKILDLAIRGKLVPQDPNDEPASELLKKIKAEKETLIKSGKLKRGKHESFIFRGDDNCYYEQIDEKRVDITEDIPFDIPESWSWCRLGSFANIIMGQSPDGSSVNNSGSGIEFHQGKIYFGERFLQPSTQRTIAPTRVVPAKSVLICVRAPVGIVNITNREICIGRGLAAAIPFHGISESFLAYWISARKNSLIEGATGSTFLAVSVDQVKGLLIPIPPLSEQQRITEKIAEINLALEATLE